MRHSVALRPFLRWVLVAMVALMGSAPGSGEESLISPRRTPTTLERPKSYGIEDYSVTVVPAIAFYPESASSYFTSGSRGRYGPMNSIVNFYAPVDVPPGAIIDYIGLNSTTDAPNAIGVTLYARLEDGNLLDMGGLGSTVHGWQTDYNAAPFDSLTIPKDALILHVQQGSFPTLQFFGQVEVWWRRTVIASSFVAFDDVPLEHPFHRFIGALAASGITAGCGGTNFCPDNPVTRGQMAVFLAKALGLHVGSTAP